MKSILVIADFDETGGTGTYFKRLLAYFSGRYSVHVVLHPDNVHSRLLSYMDGLGITYSFDYSIFPKLDSFLIRAFRRLKVCNFYLFVRDVMVYRRLEQKYKFDFYCISQGGGYRYFAFLQSRKPLLLLCHSLFIQSSRTDIWGRLYVRLFNGIHVENKTISVDSKFGCELFQKNIHSRKLSECSIHIHNYGESPEKSSGDITRNKSVVTIGQVVEYKNPETWLAVARAVGERFAGQVKFIWAGTGGMLKEMQERSRDDTDIEFVGFVDSVNELYQGAAVYFQPSIWENHSIAVVEAMAYGIPCVVSDVGGMPESIENGMQGYVCEARSVDQYVDAISSLIEDLEKREEMGQRAKQKFNTTFTQGHWEKNIGTAIEGILGVKE